MNVYYINSRTDQDCWRTVLNDALNTEAKRITTARQLREAELGEDAVLVLSDTFPDPYKALLTLLKRPERMTVFVMTALPLKDHLPLTERKKVWFLQMPMTEKAWRERIRRAMGMKGTDENRSYFWGTDPRMTKARNLLIRQKWNTLPIHIRGEIGTGKSQMARWIADELGLAERFVYVNCSGLGQDSLGMDKLFGHTEGAFTDARNKRLGLIGEADGGILFLDEVQDLPPDARSNLLTVIETGRWRPLGSDSMEMSRFRLITASSATREELYAKLGAALMSRIEGITISIPPLRERKADIPLLMERLKEKLSPAGREYGISDMEPWMTYDWPNNIRELIYKMEYYGCSGMMPPELQETS